MPKTRIAIIATGIATEIPISVPVDSPPDLEFCEDSNGVLALALVLVLVLVGGRIVLVGVGLALLVEADKLVGGVAVAAELRIERSPLFHQIGMPSPNIYSPVDQVVVDMFPISHLSPSLVGRRKLNTVFSVNEVEHRWPAGRVSLADAY